MSTVLIPKPTTTVTVAGHVVKVKTGSTVALDETQEYVTAELELPMLDEAVVEDIDPRDGVRAVISSRIGDGPVRTFDVGVRERTIDHKKKTVTLSCASDETLLGDYAPLVDDNGARVHEASLRGVVGYVLARIGATLAAGGGPDADVTAFWAATNVLPDPACVSAASYSSGGNASSLGVAVPPSPYLSPLPGGGLLYWTAPAAGQSFIYLMGARTPSVKAGEVWTLQAYMRRGTPTPENGRLRMYEIASNGDTLRTIESAPVVLHEGPWTLLTLTVTIENPATTTIKGYASGIATGVGRVYALTAPVLHRAGEVIPPFSGASGAGPGYTHAWTGTPNASPSTRTPLVERVPESLRWPAGVSGWDFLMPLTSAAGLRLFCDGGRRWWLVPRNHMHPGLVAATAGNTREGTDTITRDGDLWADGVVARFRWPGQNGEQLEQSDTAGSAGKVLTFDFDRPYPGPGTAAFILNRMQGQGRSQEVVTVTNYAATPGMEARLTMPDTAVQIGRVTRVEFGLTEGFMVLGSRGLTDTPPTAYIFGDPGIRYQDVPAGMTYNTFDWSLI